ncbi:hypothetical protein Tco_0199735 [Tanacetum coccineum]
MSSLGAPSIPSYSSGPSTPPSYSSGPSTPTNYFLGSSRNAECSNCKHLVEKISVLKAQWKGICITATTLQSREVFCWTLVCGSRDALPSLVVPLVHLSLPLVSLFFQPRTYNLSTLPFRDSVQIVENDLVVKKFPENDLDVKKF